MIEAIPHKDKNRTVHPTDKFIGMTQLCKGGRCWQMAGTGEAVEEALRAHIKQAMEAGQ